MSEHLSIGDSTSLRANIRGKQGILRGALELRDEFAELLLVDVGDAVALRDECVDVEVELGHVSLHRHRDEEGVLLELLLSLQQRHTSK